MSIDRFSSKRSQVMCTRNRNGFTLIELVVFIVIVGAAVAGVLGAYAQATRDSADPVVKKQALAIAESLLEEIQQMPFTYCDPDDPNVATATSAAGCTTPEAIGPDAGESRYSAATPFDNVNDYHGYNTAVEVPPGIKDLTNTAIAGLGQYNAAVTVAAVALSGIPAGDALLITVVVTAPGNLTVSVDGYRTRYAPTL
jgi:MSHA pilin protein MshD